MCRCAAKREIHGVWREAEREFMRERGERVPQEKRGECVNKRTNSNVNAKSQKKKCSAQVCAREERGREAMAKQVTVVRR